ncbi:hypothetical protein ACTTAI_09820 [Rhodobacter capsulatus]|uniref:hypothetical protein n=1 Tax=Rhodobacter capsulatus TaxID=1061 RepID=UPI004026BC80
MTAATTAAQAFAPMRPDAAPQWHKMPALSRGFAAQLREVPPSHLLTTAILVVLWSGVFLWRFA